MGLLCTALSQTQAQDFGFNHVATLPYADQLANIWGYTAPGGTEYALVGTYNGTSIVSLANPSLPVEVAFIDGTNSIWRELRTWGDRAYVVADNTNDGVLIIDLSQLPASTSHQFVYPYTNIGGNVDSVTSAHTIHIDEEGYMYLMGSNLNSGGTLIFDLNTTPASPVFLGATDAVYAHDSYTRNDTLYTSDIYAGTFSVYDITDRTTPVLLATQQTPFTFTHNAWLSDDSRTLFTTDERANAYVTAYDISDLGNITELDRFRRYETEGTGVIPHNAHVKDDYVYVAYYTDGLSVLDGSRPNNLVEVAHYDSYTISSQTGFYGDWGVYPYLPSGAIIISDMQTGLHILEPTMQRACWLEGVVTEMGTGTLLSNVAITLDATPIYTSSELDGEYRTGIAAAGSYDVTFVKAGYVPKTVSVALQNGIVTIENVELEPAVPFVFAGQVKDAANNNGVANAVVQFKSSLYDYTANADANGNFSISGFYADTYTAWVGSWGYYAEENPLLTIDAQTSSPVFLLDKGYRDEFLLDLGWTVSGAAVGGEWERAQQLTPVYNFQGWNAAPPQDIFSDLGTQCYVTGNNDNGSYGSDDVDAGTTTLSSPVFDLTGYTNPYINYYYWWINEGGGGAPNDTLVVELSNGVTTVQVATYHSSLYEWSAVQSHRVSDFIAPTANMRVHFRTGDDASSGNIVEAALDVFEVTDGFGLPTNAIGDNADFCRLAPNPFRAQFALEYQLSDATWQHLPNPEITVFNALGQCIHRQPIAQAQGILSLGEQWQAGIYWIRLADKSYPVVKH